jgi:hypothetical protein
VECESTRRLSHQPAARTPPPYRSGLNSLGQKLNHPLDFFDTQVSNLGTLGASTALYGVILALAKSTGNQALFVHARVAQAADAIVGQHDEMPPVH